MAAQIAHEIRNPIASMRLKAENALAKPLEQQSAALRAILDEVERLDDLLERLLAVTRLGELHRAPIALKPWLQARIDNLREQALQTDVTLSSDAPDETWSFDEKSMSRALDNLLLNAMQHAPPGGWIKLKIDINDERCGIIVENSGGGVAPEEREKIFEPFVSTRSDGAGLGLSIAREVVEAHGGSLRCVESKAGARFEMELPCLKS
jgi:signal transduction histidine kinase